MDKIDHLNIKRAFTTDALSCFHCGVEQMDKFIHDKENGLELYIKSGFTNLWIVFTDTKPIAFFSLSKSSIILNTDDKKILDSGEFIISEGLFEIESHYPAVELDYFAIDEEYQRKGLGESLVSEIIEKIKKDLLSATMFLTVNAIHNRKYSAVGFYKNCGFEESEHGKLSYLYNEFQGTDTRTVLMYLPIFH